MMQNISYFHETPGQPASADDLEAFKKYAGIERLSPTFVEFCTSLNGGYHTESCSYFYPRPAMREYWESDVASSIDPQQTMGVTSDERFSITHWSDNGHNIWSMPRDFFCIATDTFGSKLVSRLKEDDDAVYFWWPQANRTFFRITDTLAEFYAGLEANRTPDGEEEDVEMLRNPPNSAPPRDLRLLLPGMAIAIGLLIFLITKGCVRM